VKYPPIQGKLKTRTLRFIPIGEKYSKETCREKENKRRKNMIKETGSNLSLMKQRIRKKRRKKEIGKKALHQKLNL